MASHLHHHSYDEGTGEMPSSYSSPLSQPGQSGSPSPPAPPSPSSSHEYMSRSADGSVRLAGERERIEENDVLAAVLEGHSAHGTIELAAPVFHSPAFADAIGKQSSQGREGSILSVEAAKDERRNELQRIMRDRSLGRDERRRRTAEVKRRYDELIERAERNEASLTEERRREEERGRASREASSGEQDEARLTEEQSREEERGLVLMKNLLANNGRTSFGEEGRVHCVHDANIASAAPGPIEKGSFRIGALEPKDAPVQREQANFLEEGKVGAALGDRTFGDGVPGGGEADAGRWMFEPFGAVLRNAIDRVPVFDSKGKFTHHESRRVLDRGPTSPSVRSGRSYEDELRDIAEQLDGTAHRRNRRNCRRCAVAFAVLFAIVLAIVLAGLTREGLAAPTWRERPADKSVQSEEAGAAATPSVAENAPRPANSPHTTVHSKSAKMFKVGKSDKGALGGAPSPDLALESATESNSTLTESPTLATFVPTETSAPTGGKPTEKPTHRKHHGGRHSPAPTSKPTRKQHDHSDDKSTGKPAHKNHHGRHHSSTPTPKPTRKRHHHSDAPTTGKPTHRKHGHGGRHSSTPTPKPTRKHTYGGPVPGWFIQEECYDGVLC